MIRSRLTTAIAAVAASTAALAGCSNAAPDAADESSSTVEERQAPSPRLVVSYDGGVRVLDASTGDEVADLPLDGFLRLSTADNGRHAFVTAADGFRVLDTGTWTERHGDHSHYRTSEPSFTGMTFAGSEPGHVVAHESRISLFFDGTGDVKIVDPADLKKSDVPSVDYRAPKPHHGVAVSRADGSLVVTQGDENTRTGVGILTRDRREVASTTDCPGVHGEAAASDGVLTFGCQNGIVIVRGDEIKKVAAPDPYGRIGNQRGSEASTVVLGDYKTQADLPDGQIERPRRFSLTDTATGSLRIVDLPTSYSFRSLARGPGGEAVILGTDGALYVYDASTAALTGKHRVIEPWTEPTRWQEAMPSLTVQGDVAYVSDPATKSVRGIDVRTGRTVMTADLGVAPVETIAVTG